jgi:hypothetical protein
MRRVKMDQKSTLGRRPASGDNVRNQTVFQHLYLVAQAQFALLHARDLKLVRLGQLAERGDRAIQIAMLEAKKLQSLLDFFDRQHRLESSDNMAARSSSHRDLGAATGKPATKIRDERLFFRKSEISRMSQRKIV